MARPQPSPLPATLFVEPWPDPVIDAVGHEVRSAYVERFWLGVLGPSATWLLRRLVAGLDEAPDGYDLDLSGTASELGLGHHAGRNAPFVRSFDRCCRFGATQLVADTTLRVRRHLPPLTRMQVLRLPESLQAAHQAWTEGPSASNLPVDQLRERARGLALSLLDLGEDVDATERQLHRWRVHPAMAHEAVAWARQRHAATVAVRQDDLPPEAA